MQIGWPELLIGPSPLAGEEAEGRRGVAQDKQFARKR
jgi:hypothetical protein